MTHAIAITIASDWQSQLRSRKLFLQKSQQSRIVAIREIALGQKIAAIRNHTLVVATISGGFPDVTPETLQKPRKIGRSRVQRVGFRGCFLSRSDFSELRLQSLAICDFEVAAIRITEVLQSAARVVCCIPDVIMYHSDRLLLLIVICPKKDKHCNKRKTLDAIVQRPDKQRATPSV